MNKLWSAKWVSSKQPRKQRKYRLHAPLHIKRKFISVHLAPELRKRYSRRSLSVRKGDEVIVMKGSLKGKRGAVEKVDSKACKVYIEGVKVKKSDGSETAKAFQPCNLMIASLKLDDKMRGKALERSSAAAKQAAPKTEEAKK